MSKHMILGQTWISIKDDLTAVVSVKCLRKFQFYLQNDLTIVNDFPVNCSTIFQLTHMVLTVHFSEFFLTISIFYLLNSWTYSNDHVCRNIHMVQTSLLNRPFGSYLEVSQVMGYPKLSKLQPFQY